MRVYGSYTSEVAAANAIEELNAMGYSRSAIKVVSSRSLGPEFDTVDTVDVKDGDARGEDDRGFFEKVRDFFSFSEYSDDYYAGLDDDKQSVLSEYRSNLDNGEIVILVDDEGRTPSDDYDITVGDTGQTETMEPIQTATPDMTGTTYDTEPVVDPAPVADTDMNYDTERTTHTEEEHLELRHEELDVDTHEVQDGEAVVRKAVHEETEQVDVPVRHEELVIERRPTADGDVREGGIDNAGEGEQEIHIPLSHEEVEVTKRNVKDEEVAVKKEVHEETETVEETVKYEDVEADRTVETDYRDDDNMNR